MRDIDNNLIQDYIYTRASHWWSSINIWGEIKNRTAKPTVAGIFAIIAGGLGIVGDIGALIGFRPMFGALGMPGIGNGLFTGISIVSLSVAVLALVGGIFTLQRQRWGWSLAGAIAAIFAMFLLGVVATILTAISKNEFDQQKVQPSTTTPSSDSA